MLTQIASAGLALVQAQAAPQPLPDRTGLTPDQITQISLEAIRRGSDTQRGIIGALIPILVPIAFFGAIVFVFWLMLRQKQARLKARMEFNKQLLDKFTSGPELAEFLASEGGRQLLAETQPQGKKTLRNGIVLTALGLGMLGLSFTKRGDPDLLLPAVMVLALGVGFLVSAVVSQRLLNQQPQKKTESGNPVVS